MRNIEAFLRYSENGKRNSDGILKPYHLHTLDGIESNDLMNTGFGQYGEMNNAWTSDDRKGFIKISGNAQKTYFHL
jgi:argininosuccinate synthase